MLDRLHLIDACWEMMKLFQRIVNSDTAGFALLVGMGVIIGRILTQVYTFMVSW